MSDLTVAKTILAQLGGGRFKAMTGAKNFGGTEDSLSFSIPGGGGFAKNGINSVYIRLTSMDDYEVKFQRIRKCNGMPMVRWESSHEGVYADQLQSLFTEETGLNTHL